MKSHSSWPKPDLVVFLALVMIVEPRTEASTKSVVCVLSRSKAQRNRFVEIERADDPFERAAVLRQQVHLVGDSVEFGAGVGDAAGVGIVGCRRQGTGRRRVGAVAVGLVLGGAELLGNDIAKGRERAEVDLGFAGEAIAGLVEEGAGVFLDGEGIGGDGVAAPLHGVVVGLDSRNSRSAG